MTDNTQSASVRIDFTAHEGDLGRISLEKDRQRELPPDSRSLDSGLTVSVQKSHYIRLYPKEAAEVRAVNGSIRSVGADIDVDRQMLIMFDPETKESGLPVGVTNVRIEKVGRSFDVTGKDINVSYQYKKTSNTVVSNTPHYGAVRVVYDYPYSLYEYTFSGSCPITPPDTVDDIGNAIPLRDNPFSDGLVMAVNPMSGQMASLSLVAPVCEYGMIAYSFNDTRKDLELPDMELEIDPEAPVRLTGAGTRIRSECNVLMYPDYNAEVVPTEGVLSKLESGSREIRETVTFNGASSASLSKTPMSGVVVTVISSDSSGKSVSWASPGDTITDVVYSSSGRYSNPRPRIVNPDELVAVNVFGHPVRVFAVVEVKYHATFRKFRYQFSYDDERATFKPAHIICSDPSNSRGSFLEVSPPNLTNQTKRGR